jgi:hypothetical protein
VWQHILDRVEQRHIPLRDLEILQDWVRSQPDAPDGDWYPEGDRQNDFGSFKLCGSGELPKTVLLKHMKPYGERIE